MANKFRIWALLLGVGLLPPCGSAQNRIEDFRSRFARESDPIHRARIMPQLEKAEFQAIGNAVDDNRSAEAFAILQEYRDQIETCAKDLDAKHINAEKHPNGFKQLQFALRDSLRHLDALLVGFTSDEQMPFLMIRSELQGLDRHLMRKLFPGASTDKPLPPD